MALSADERRNLTEIERALRWSDRALDRSLSAGRFRNQRMYYAGTWVAASFIPGVAVGTAARLAPVCLAAWVLFMIGMLLRTLAE